MCSPLPTYFISHGGGPWPDVPDMRANHRLLESSLTDIVGQVGVKPTAVLMISAHWEEPDFTVMANPTPGMVYDFYGFPENTYKVRYPAPGLPSLATRVLTLLQAAGISASLNTERGYDHGAYVPMQIIYPEADVPMVQLSIRSSYDPAAHIAAGRALASLRSEGVLIIGSGLSYHNLRKFGVAGALASREFDDWLYNTMLQEDPQTRTQRIQEWARAPSARLSHPQEDHLVPLFVALGAAEHEPATCYYRQHDFFGGVSVSSYKLG
mmetsp:Transcript_23392/g.41505  ORF Transcript_23392/g.41505 Transcript_23392/m.41505 type:complete len:267 (-) Transcript_23392:58-858(-)